MAMAVPETGEQDGDVSWDEACVFAGEGAGGSHEDDFVALEDDIAVDCWGAFPWD